MSRKTDITRQIVFGDLSESELEDIFKVVQAERNKRKGIVSTRAKYDLSEEQKALLTCCVENRNYNISGNADKVVCPICGSEHIVKYGFNKGRQRYKCKDCGKLFGATDGTVAYKSKLSAETWIELIKYVLQGESCRFIAKNLHINKTTVLYNRHRIATVLRQLDYNKDDFSSIAEVDEYYYPLSFKDKKNPLFFLETLGRLPFTHRSELERYAYVEKQGYSPVFVDTIFDHEKICKNELLFHVEVNDLKTQVKFSRAVNDMEQPKIFDVLKTLKGQPKRKVGISNQQVCILTCIDTNGNIFAKPVCVGRISPTHIEKALLSHLNSDTHLVSDSHSAYKTVANKHKIPINQIPSGKHTSGGYHLGHINGYHHNISDFLHGFYGVSTKYLPLYIVLQIWKEKHKNLTLQEQAYEIINLLSMQANKIPLGRFKDIPIAIDMKGMLDKPQMA